jgi:hypothetical protein
MVRQDAQGYLLVLWGRFRGLWAGPLPPPDVYREPVEPKTDPMGPGAV